ncbi:MAG: type II secretion system protein GspM [Terriglobia bacterium]
MKNLNKREKWIIAAGLLAVVLYLVMQYGILPFWESLGGYSAKIDQYAKRIVNYRRILMGQDSVKAALAEAQQQRTSAETGLLTSASEALANAEMQGILKQLAASKGLVLRRSDVLPVKSLNSDYGKVSIRVEVAGRIEQLTDFLAAFPNGTPLLFVEEMRITPVANGDLKQKLIVTSMQISGVRVAETNAPQPAKKS